MDTREFIQRAFDSNAFLTSTTTAGYVNPEIWEKELLVHVKANLVMAQLGKNYNMRGGANGDTLNVTVGVEPTAAAAVAESASVAIQAYEKTQVIFTPSERGTAYQMSNKERDRTFIDLMSDMVQQLGYALAKRVDTDIVDLITASAANAVTVNDVDYTALDSSDTLDYDTIVNGKVAILDDKLTPKALVVNPSQYGQLLKDQQFKQFNFFGEKVAKTGLIGSIAGLEVYVTTQIASASNKAKALIVGVDDMGVSCFGIAIKRDPYIETEYHALERRTDIVAVMDYDVKMLRVNGACTVGSYSA